MWTRNQWVEDADERPDPNEHLVDTNMCTNHSCGGCYICMPDEADEAEDFVDDAVDAQLAEAVEKHCQERDREDRK